MEQTIEATFDGEVFRPDEKIDLKPNTKVKITVEETKKLKLVEMRKKETGEQNSFIDYLKSVSIDAPPDYAKNIDEYLYRGKSIENE